MAFMALRACVAFWCFLGAHGFDSSYADDTTLLQMSTAAGPPSPEDAANFLGDVSKILMRPEMPEHIRKASEGEPVEIQLVTMQFMGLGVKYGSELSGTLAFDGMGPAFHNLCSLAKTDENLRNKVQEVSNRWHEIIGSLGEAPKLTKEQASAFMREMTKLLNKHEVKDCAETFTTDKEAALNCWTKYSKPVVTKYGLKPFTIPSILPQVLLHGQSDPAMREEAMAYYEKWIAFADAMGMSSVKSDIKLAGKSGTGMMKAYAISFVDEIGTALDRPELAAEVAKFREGDPCAEAAIVAYFEPICSKHHFPMPVGSSVPPVMQLAKLGPDVRDRVWAVISKWATMMQN